MEPPASRHIATGDAFDPLTVGASPGHAFLAAGNPRTVLEAAAASIRRGDRGVLALVLETEGSTYAGVGDLVLFDDDLQVGWLSGGCLEPQLAKRARDVADSGGIDLVEIDTRSDDDLLAGSALGCRGRLRIAMLPLRSMPGVDALIDAWLHGGVSLLARISTDAEVEFQAGSQRAQWRLRNEHQAWPGDARSWRLLLQRLPRLLVLGAGPETSTLIPLLRELGWFACLAERRSRWSVMGHSADAHLQLAPASAIHDVTPDAVLVMHHDFELDREALDALAGTDIDFIGLLGPRRRRDDLFKLLAPNQCESLVPRLRSPVGLDLGGRGPEAIALSIAAQLQQWRVVAASA
ncbi:XdhC family protein [Thermomonas carbonis]|uniref:XdhC family protein n=1 Tax=Thermomonas carbonis TaxID=1463158 RepID=UPI001E3511DF|nr:XdhC family protein [Thermomonas carbonis]